MKIPDLIRTISLIALTLTVAAAAGAVDSGRTARDTIALRSAVVDAERAAASSRDLPDAELLLVKFPGPVSSRQRTALEAATVRVFTFLPHDAFLVRIAPGAGPDLAREAGASWTAPYLPEHKLSPEIAATRADDPRRRPVMIHLFPDVDLDRTRAAIEGLTGRRAEGVARHTRFPRIRVLLDGGEISRLRQPLAELAEVYWLEREARRAFLNDTTVWVGQSGTSGGGATPVFDHGILGAGQVVGVLDTGLDIDHCFFRDPVETTATNQCDGGTAVNPDHRKVLAVDFLWSNECSSGISNSEWDTQGHGTHVAGTVAGDNIANPGTHNGSDGMAPQAKLVIQDCGYQFNDCADCPGIGCPVVDLVPVFEQPYAQGARIHTNSWGDEENDPAFGEYTSGSEDVDTVMWNHKDYLLIFAAGNNGGSTNTVDSPSTAKSSLSIGATGRASGADTIATFSSRGPTDDGRIKPSLTVPGSSIVSASNDGNIGTDNCSTTSSSGTSMAAPGAAGLAALVRQYLVDGFYPTGAAVPADALTPSAALLRAALVNSGQSMTNESAIPSNSQGWGRILLDNVLYFPGDNRRLWLEDEAGGFPLGSSGDTFTYQLSVASGGEPLEVTLAWTDHPSTPAAATNINNDLDLQVSGPGGTFLGNVFSGGQSVSGGGADRVNTLENVLIPTPAPGLWTVTVRSHAVPDGPQPFAVVATGDIATCSGPATAQAVAGSESVILSGGDGDDFLDNCESATVSFAVMNGGSAAASNVRIVSVSSPSHPGTVFSTPTWTAASIAACDVDANAWIGIASAAGLSHGDTLTIEVEVTNDEIAPQTTVATLSIPGAETDLGAVAEVTFDFEADLDGWTVTSGTFARADSLGAASGSWYLQSSADLPNRCDVVSSPPLVLTAASTLELWTNYEIEDFDGSNWWDRANVSLVDGGAGTVLTPDGGRPYDVPAGSAYGTCGTETEPGWAGTNRSWAASTFSATALGSAAVAGRPVTLELAYGTDPAVELGGFAVDGVRITDVLATGPDGQDDACVATLIFADGFEGGSPSAWSSTVP